MQIITPAQCRAARGILNWSQPQLAAKCGLHVQTISSFEQDKKIPSKRTLETIASAFDSEGICFAPDDGVHRKANRVVTFNGQDGFAEFKWDVYETAKKHGGEICVSNVDERLYTERLSKEIDDAYMQKMEELKKHSNYTFKILVNEGDYNFVGSAYAEYRWTPRALFSKVPFYVYGPKLAFIFFEEDTTIHMINNHKIAESQRVQFNLLWNQALIPPLKKNKKA